MRQLLWQAGIVILLACSAMAQTKATIDSLAGVWGGSLNTGAFSLRIIIHLDPEGRQLKATLDSPDQAAFGIDGSHVTLDNTRLSFSIPSIGARYEGLLTDNQLAINGTWRQAGQQFQLDLVPAATIQPPKRPQEPRPPFPYYEEEIHFLNTSAAIELAGTLTIPSGEGPFPAAILISGSGPQDRDETLMGHKPFWVLADHLTRSGIAVLRYDDRGVASSQGDRRSAAIPDFATDVEAAIAYLRNRPEIQPSRIGLIGHSEGGMVAPIVASRNKSLGFVVLMAAPGDNGATILARQQADMLRLKGASEGYIREVGKLAQEVYQLIDNEPDNQRAGQQIEALQQRGGSRIARLYPADDSTFGGTSNQNSAAIQVLLSPWFRHLLSYDPRPDLKRISCPVLAINGDKDVQVAFETNLLKIEAAVRSGGNADVTTVPLPGLNHLFQSAETGAVEEYATIEETFSPTALVTISDWILERCR